MKVTATTLPRRSARASGAPSAVVSANAGAVPMVGRRASRPGWCASAGAVATTTSASAAITRSPRTIVFPSSALQLFLELVEDAPVGAVGENLLRVVLQHANL